MTCPNCGTQDPGPGPFCMSCGYRLPTSSPTAPTQPPTRTLPGQSPPVSAALGPAGRASAYPSPLDPANRSSASSPPSAAYPSIGQMGNAGTVPVSIWGPFAGYGTRGRHVSWLINDQGERAEALRDAVAARFERREIPEASVAPVKLVRQGVLADSRPYFLVRRGLTTAGLHVAHFGQDLYVSQVTYFKGPISTMRILILVAMALFAVLYPVMINQASSQIGVSLFGGVGDSLGSLVLLACCLGPFYLMNWLALGILALFSGYKYLTEKDVLAALRVPPNEFDVDDTVALEKSVEQTVREALDAVGIEQRLMPQAAEYGFRRRLI